MSGQKWIALYTAIAHDASTDYWRQAYLHDHYHLASYCMCVRTPSGLTVTSVDEEKRLNQRLTKPVDEFVKIMNELNLPYPKYIGRRAFSTFQPWTNHTSHGIDGEIFILLNFC